MSGVSFYCKNWQLSDPERIAQNFTSDVYKVKFDGENAVLKILNEKGKQFESKGAAVLRCFNGNGAVRLLKADEGAHLLEFIDGVQLKSLVEQGSDKLAMDVLCDVINKIHSYSGPCPSELISMERNFRALFEKVKSENQNTIYHRGADLAHELIATATDLRVLHGDIHHENILKHPVRGWLLIDPQCLFGERTYDFANAFYNPNGFSDLVASSERISRLANKFSQAFGIEKKRILQYAFAYGCLSASWCLEDDQSPDATLRIAQEIERLISENLSARPVTSKKTSALDSHYVTPKLAQLYDLDSGWSKEREFYLSLAGESRKRVLDLGCGTGLICNALAAKGHEVTGVDPAPAMLEVAKQKPNGSKIEWVQSSAQNFQSNKLYDLIIMTGNAFQVLLEEEDLQASCQMMQKQLSPDGLIAFESRNPHLDWASRWNYEMKLNTSVGVVIESRNFLSWSGSRMSFELRYQFPDDKLISQSQLRFWSAKEIESHLSEAGLCIQRFMGDWEFGDFMENSTEEMVFIARHPEIKFVAVEEEHILFLREWLKEPHVAEFWQETDDEEKFREKFLSQLQDRGVSPFIIYIGTTPVGYIQSYEAQKVGGGWWPDAKPGTFGIDQFIGKPDFINRGWGAKIIKQFVEGLFQSHSVKEIITDPDPKNIRAIRCYEKVGFARVGEVKTPGGEAMLMRLDRAATEPITIRKLAISDENAFFTAVEQWTDPSFTFASEYRPGMNFSDYLAVLSDREAGKSLPSDRVPDTVFYGFLDDKIIGRISIRHELNDFLFRVGGHIGYAVLTDYRKRGFAKSMLRQALLIARQLGLCRVLLTCDDNNLGSIRTIEASGGILENAIDMGEGKPPKRRYWIDLQNQVRSGGLTF